MPTTPSNTPTDVLAVNPSPADSAPPEAGRVDTDITSAPPAPAAPAPAPVLAGRYELLGVVGRGGMGVVYRAIDRPLGREVAVKILQERFGPASRVAGRFADEARITGRLQHPAIPSVHELGALPDGRPFLAMKLIRGRTLAEILRDTGPGAALVPAFEKVCEAVGYAHSQGVVHRDLKPDNVMVGAFGEVQVMDWGLARVVKDEGGKIREEPEPACAGVDSTFILPPSSFSTVPGTVLGTPAFMAPEQARGEPVDARADVFALGGVLCEILTGQPPFVAGTGQETHALAAVGGVAGAFARLDRCGADPGLVSLAKRCLAPDSGDRPADGKAVADAVAGLRAAADERARRAEAERAATEARAAEQRKRRRVQAALGLAVTTSLVVAALGLWWVERADAARRAELTRVEGERKAELARVDGDRRTERAAVVAGARQAVAAALVQSAEARDKFRFVEAAAALDQADAQIPDDAPPELRDRLAAARADLALVRELDDIRFGRVRGGDPIAGAAALPEKYRAAFLAHGFDPTASDVEAVVSRVASSPVRRQTVVALDDWATYGSDSAERIRLLAVLRRVDPHPFGDRLRDPATRGDRAALDRIAAETELTAVPPDLFVLYAQMRPGPWPQAREQIGAVAALNRDHFWVQMEAGYYFTIKEPRPADAAAYYRAALALRPDNRYALTMLGANLRGLGDWAAAAATYREVIRLDPKDAAGHYNLGVVLRGGRDHARAAAAFRDSLALVPKDADAHLQLAGSLLATGDVDGAIAAYRAAAELRPNSADIHYQLGGVLDRKGDLEGAIQAYRAAAAANPKSARIRNSLGVVLFLRRDLDGALAAYREAVRIDPDLFDARNNLGNVLRAKGDVPGAIASYREAIRIDPNQPTVHNNLGWSLYSADDVDGAIASYREAIRLDPKYARAHNNLGMALVDTGDLDGAVAAFRAAATFDPKFAWAHSNLGDALAARGDLDGAVAAYRESLRVAPTFKPAKDGLAEALKRQAERRVPVAPPPREVGR